MKQLDLREIDDRWGRNRQGRYFVRTWKRGESSVGGVEWSGVELGASLVWARMGPEPEPEPQG